MASLGRPWPSPQWIMTSLTLRRSSRAGLEDFPAVCFALAVSEHRRKARRSLWLRVFSIEYLWVDLHLLYHWVLREVDNILKFLTWRSVHLRLSGAVLRVAPCFCLAGLRKGAPSARNDMVSRLRLRAGRATDSLSSRRSRRWDCLPWRGWRARSWCCALASSFTHKEVICFSILQNIKKMREKDTQTYIYVYLHIHMICIWEREREREFSFSFIPFVTLVILVLCDRLSVNSCF